MLSRKARVIRRKLYCLNPNPQWWKLHTRCDNASMAAPQERIVQVSRSAPSGWRDDGERLHLRG
jgi:hypothetical protein